jgi:hypothetical protein
VEGLKKFEWPAKSTFFVVQRAEKFAPLKSAGQDQLPTVPLLSAKGRRQPEQNHVNTEGFAFGSNRSPVHLRRQGEHRLILASAFFWPLDMGRASPFLIRQLFHTFVAQTGRAGDRLEGKGKKGSVRKAKMHS